MANERQKRAAGEIGAATGMVGGAFLGYKGVKGAGRVRRGAQGSRAAYKMSRSLLRSGRASSTAMAVRSAPAGMRGPKTGATLPAIGAGYLGGLSGSIGGAAGGEALVNRKKTPVSKAGRLMSDAEVKRRKKLQGHISQATGAIGLAALGGTLAASRPGRTALRKIPKLESKIKAPAPKDPNRDRIKGATTPLLATGAGLGGLGSFNFASYTNAESRKRNMVQPVKKDMGMDMGYFGEEGHPLTHEAIEAEISKAWEPLARNYDPEAKRHGRAKKYEAGLAGAAVGTGAGAGVAGGAALKPLRENKKISTRAKNLPSVKAGVEARKLTAVKRGKVGAGLAGASAVTGIGSALVHRQRKGSWQSYGKRDTMSAFGVDHSDNPNGQHRETEN